MNLLLIGKPNVGKSSIFNILSNNNLSIIHPTEGTTRDWNVLSLNKYPDIKIYDSPGFKIEKNKLNINKFNFLYKHIDVFLYVVEYNNLDDSNENYSLNKIRTFSKDIILLINKDDELNKKNNFDHLGIKNKFYLSCSHRLGFEQLFQFLKKYHKNKLIENKIDFSISIYGKPNAGKSTLLNKILGYNRSATSKLAGTTSDIVFDTFKFKKKSFQIFDTAGIGRKSKTKQKSINSIAINKTIQNIKQADLNLLLIDSIDGFDRQSKRIYNLLINSKLLVIIFNKLDLIKDKRKFFSDIKYQFKNDIASSKNISLIFISALKNKDIRDIKNLIFSKSENKILKISTNKINNWLKKTISNYPHPLIRGKKVNFKYATQIKSHPIRVKIFCNYSTKILKSYKTYLLNDFIKKFNIKDKNIKFIFSSTSNPYIST